MASRKIHMRALDPEIIRKIREISGENVYLCMQCGTCTAVCPMSDAMECTPRRAMHLLQFGQTEDVLDSRMGYHCASCHTCTVRCPWGIDVPRVLEAIRLLALRKNIDVVHPNRVARETMREAPQIVFVSGFRKLTG